MTRPPQKTALRAARIEAGMTRAALAREAEVSVRLLSRIEAGESVAIKGVTALRIAKILRTPPYELFGTRAL